MRGVWATAVVLVACFAGVGVVHRHDERVRDRRFVETARQAEREWRALTPQERTRALARALAVDLRDHRLVYRP